MSRDNPFTTSRRNVLRKGALITGLSVVGNAATARRAAAGIGEGRVLHYPMNNIRPDGTVKDASPENNHGVNNGATVVRGSGQVGNAFEFDGTDAWVEVPDLGVTEPATVSF